MQSTGTQGSHPDPWSSGADGRKSRHLWTISQQCLWTHPSGGHIVNVGVSERLCAEFTSYIDYEYSCEYHVCEMTRCARKLSCTISNGDYLPAMTTPTAYSSTQNSCMRAPAIAESLLGYGQRSRAHPPLGGSMRSRALAPAEASQRLWTRRRTHGRTMGPSSQSITCSREGGVVVEVLAITFLVQVTRERVKGIGERHTMAGLTNK